MSTTTTNLGLVKPERSDNYNVDVMSENMDKIDTKITALEKRVTIDANGNFTGKINVSELSKTDTNNLLVCTASAGGSGTGGTVTVPSGTVTRHNTSIINCTLTDKEILEQSSTGWSAVLKNNGSNSNGVTYTFTVKDETGTTVHTQNIWIDKGSKGTVGFTRNFAHSYTCTTNYPNAGQLQATSETSVKHYVQ